MPPLPALLPLPSPRCLLRAVSLATLMVGQLATLVGVKSSTKLVSAAKLPSKKCIPMACANGSKTPKVTKPRKLSCRPRRPRCKPLRKATLRRCPPQV